MKDGYKIMDSDLHVIETGALYENYMPEEFFDQRPEYLGWSPTNFPHWRVQGELIPPWALSDEVIKAQRFLDAPTEELYTPIKTVATMQNRHWKPWTSKGLISLSYFERLPTW